MSLTQEQLNELGRAFHRGDAVSCPLCHSQLAVEDCAYLGRCSRPLRFTCPVHQSLGESDPPDLRIPWTGEQMRQMVADHLRHSEARCPEDQARVPVLYEPKEEGAYVQMICPSCGRMQAGMLPE
jgi:hypothetical protein